MDSFANRRHIIRFIMILVGLIFAIKLFMLQVVDSTYKVRYNNAIVTKKQMKQQLAFWIN